MTDQNPNPHGGVARPVLKKVEAQYDLALSDELIRLVESGKLWMFCGEYDGRELDAIDAAEREHGGGIYQAFDRGAWGRGHWRA